MRRCGSCGAETDTSGDFCPNCGARLESGNNDVNGSGGSVPETPAQKADRYPMKWHRFLMVMLIIGGIVTIISGISTFTGFEYTQEGVDPARVYSTYPGLKSCDMFYGVVMIVMGVFQFYVRNQLNQYRARGPKLLTTMYIVSLLASVVYLGIASAATQTNLATGQTIGAILASVAFMIVNTVYYAKRKELFTE